MVKIMENPIKLDDLEENPLFLETSILENTNFPFQPPIWHNALATRSDLTRHGFLVAHLVETFGSDAIDVHDS